MEVVYSVGHSTLSADAFIELLQQHDIAVVADVRRWPVSRMEHFNQNELVQLLNRHDIDYHHLEALGAFRPEGYEAWMQTGAWQHAYEQLVATARRRTTAFMCTERSPQRCHRRFIASRLADDGWRVVHLLAGGPAQATLG